MPVSPTYPGLYIEELPNLSHTITAAPTSVTVFIGYTDPFQTQASPSLWGQATEIFSFTEYEKLYGGLYNNSLVPSDVAYAVQQFFLNGGGVAYIVALQPQLWTQGASGPVSAGGFTNPVATVAPSGATTGIVFTGLEVVDASHALTVTVLNVDPTGLTADFVFAFGSHVETYRQVSLTATITSSSGSSSPNPKFIETVLNGNSRLVTVAPATAGGYGTLTGLAAKTQVTFAYATPPPTGAFVFNSADFMAVLQENTSLDKVPIFNLMVLPAVTDPGIWAQAVAFCERKRAFLIMDPLPGYAADPTYGLPLIQDAFNANDITESINAAVYFPYLASIDSLSGLPKNLPPSGYVAGMFATIDNNRGVWKAPAGLETVLNNTTGVVPYGVLTDPTAGVLNQTGINAIRVFPGIGTVIFGARTTATQNTALQQWKYVPVRRLALFIEQSLYGSLGWAVFEPNATPLWVALRTTVEAFMLTLFNQGAFPGATPSTSFQVVCDSTTTTPTDVENGIVNILVAFAPLIPAEFVVIQIAQLAGQAQSS
jgi:phage tail sheath protein FI